MMRPSGYDAGYGFVGFLPNGGSMLFVSREEYLEYLEMFDLGGYG